ncbi:MAG TPA: substrate-binding domain-containing protein [Novosphingobium sp.]|nr:substrate-binding domain-containing protein [Novosphingobium sp.]
MRPVPASSAQALSLIERAGFTPPTPFKAPVVRSNPLLALIHDDSDRGILDAVGAGIAETLAGGEMALVVHAMPRDDAASQLRAFLQRHRPAGVVLLSPLPEREDIVRVCVDARVRCARLGPTRGGTLPANLHSLATDERQAARDLVAWLVAQGHVRIGFVAGPDGSLSAQQRELGYLDAMADAGLDRGPALIVPGDNAFDSGIEAGRILLEISPRPTAILASNDEMAAGVLHAAAQMGVAVPTQLSVAGLDDTPLSARILPALTTMHIPWKLMGAEAARLAGAGEPLVAREMDFFAKLVVRDSVQAPS